MVMYDEMKVLSREMKNGGILIQTQLCLVYLGWEYFDLV